MTNGQVTQLVRVANSLLRTAEESVDCEAEKTAKSAMIKYLLSQKLMPDELQINFRLAVSYLAWLRESE
jgi:hypothetical protein